MGDQKKIVPLFEGDGERMHEIFRMQREIKRRLEGRQPLLFEYEFDELVRRFVNSIEIYGRERSEVLVDEAYSIAKETNEFFYPKDNIYRFSYELVDHDDFNLENLVMYTIVRAITFHQEPEQMQELRTDHIRAIRCFYMCMEFEYSVHQIDDRLSYYAKTAISAYIAYLFGCSGLEPFMKVDRKPKEIAKNYERHTAFLKEKPSHEIVSEVRLKGYSAFTS